MNRHFRRLKIAVALLIAAAAFGLAGPFAYTEFQVWRLVRTLGRDGTEEARHVLYANPRTAVRHLVEALTLVEPGPHGGDPPATIWRLRMLHSITGVRFRGKTTTAVTEDQDYWLKGKWDLGRHHERHDALLFYATWMSRNITFVAPHDSQRDIIDQWRTWAQLTSETYPCNRDYDLWYFH